MADAALVRAFADRLDKEPQLARDFEQNPVTVLATNLEPGRPAYVGDKVIYRMVVVLLGLVMLGAAAGGLIAMIKGVGTDIPAALVALGSGAMGALAGLLAPSPVSPGR